MSTLPTVISGTSSLGNLYEALPFERKTAIVKAYIEANGFPAVFDTAGKYGAGLALETLGECLRTLGVQQHQVIISNKLGWARIPLTTEEPTFEPGVWKNLQHDARQQISYDGIIACYHQGNELLKTYNAQLASVHDPDEYLAAAANEHDKQQRYQDILEAYRALHDLKKQGLVQAIGVGAKSWTTIQRISRDVDLDWVMLANSLTVYDHPAGLLDFVKELKEKDVRIVNSAVFNGGFLTGSSYFNYQPVTEQNPAHQPLFEWRAAFYTLCKQFGISPAAACVYFAIHIPGVTSIALNSSSPERTRQNVAMANVEVPPAFWTAMKEQGLLNADYPYL
jgi:D-threo-aldose 1-dehydrogenase